MILLRRATSSPTNTPVVYQMFLSMYTNFKGIRFFWNADQKFKTIQRAENRHFFRNTTGHFELYRSLLMKHWPFKLRNLVGPNSKCKCVVESEIRMLDFHFFNLIMFLTSRLVAIFRSFLSDDGYNKFHVLLNALLVFWYWRIIYCSFFFYYILSFRYGIL